MLVQSSIPHGFIASKKSLDLSNQKKDPSIKESLDAISKTYGDIFKEGRLSGSKIRYVLGLKKAADRALAALEDNILDHDEILAILELIYNNSSHPRDLPKALEVGIDTGRKFLKNARPDFIEKLEKAADIWQEGMQRAEDARIEAPNAILGSLEKTGLSALTAAHAGAVGAIGAPAHFAFDVAAGVLAPPASLVIQTLHIMGRMGYKMVKDTVTTAYAASLLAYSFLSTTSAAGIVTLSVGVEKATSLIQDTVHYVAARSRNSIVEKKILEDKDLSDMPKVIDKLEGLLRENHNPSLAKLLSGTTLTKKVRKNDGALEWQKDGQTVARALFTRERGQTISAEVYVRRGFAKMVDSAALSGAIQNALIDLEG